jgi:hypothetical protein
MEDLSSLIFHLDFHSAVGSRVGWRDESGTWRQGTVISHPNIVCVKLDHTEDEITIEVFEDGRVETCMYATERGMTHHEI